MSKLPIDEIKIKPFLRWAGGKTLLLDKIKEHFPKDFNNYHEPFVGGGAVFFHLNPTGKVYLSDLNGDLINAYTQLRDNPNRIIRELENFVNEEEFYYNVRAWKPKGSIQKAVRFIYLNKAGFNGIYRVNRNGEYNVPYGRRKGIDLVERENLLLVSDRLQRAVLKEQDFGKSMAKVREGDLVFLDPPYTVAHENNGFIEYNQKIFSLRDQYRLAEWIRKINEIGAYYILTNAKHTAITEIYDIINTPRGIYRSSTIGGNGAERKRVSEFIFSNL